MRPVNSNDRLFRLLHIELRSPGGEWKRMIGDESLESCERGVKYEIRVKDPHFTFGFDVGSGSQFLVPEKALPLRD